MKKYLFILLLFSFGIIILDAQVFNYSVRQDILRNQIKNISLVNDSIFSLQDEFINGKMFSPPSNTNIHPFFINNQWKSGKIWSSGRIFDIEAIKYDIYSDFLMHIHKLVSSAYPIYFTRENVNEFIIEGHHFKYLDDFDEILKDKFKSGYYEILYDGNSKFYMRWVKTKELRRSTLESVYVENIFFILKLDGRYIQIKNQAGLIRALGDHKKELQSFMKTNGLHFSKNNYESIVKILTFYDNL